MGRASRHPSHGLETRSPLRSGRAETIDAETRALGHGGLLPALVDAFAASAPGLVLAMRGAAMDGDRQQLRAHVHQLAGAAAGTGGTPGAAIPWDRLDAEVGDAVRLLTQALPAAT